MFFNKTKSQTLLILTFYLFKLYYVTQYIPEHVHHNDDDGGYECVSWNENSAPVTVYPDATRESIIVNKLNPMITRLSVPVNN